MELRDILDWAAEEYRQHIPKEHYGILTASIEGLLQVAYDNSPPESQQVEVEWYRRVVATVLADRIRNGRAEEL